MQAITIAEVADELYALSPAEFTAARDERARQVRAAGHRDLAAEIKKLARPTASAWLVNQLARTAADSLSRLFEVGAALQEAQRTLAGDRLRELSAERRQVVADLIPVAAGFAADAGQPASPAVLAEVRATLEAALADPQAGLAVRSGHLTKALAYAGLGEVDLAAVVALPVGSAESSGPAAPARGAGAEPAAVAVRSRDAAVRRAAGPVATRLPGSTIRPSCLPAPSPLRTRLRLLWMRRSGAQQAWPSSGSSSAAVSTTSDASLTSRRPRTHS